MGPAELLTLDEIDLSDRAFWAGPPEVRDGAFATLRRRQPVRRFAEPEPAGPVTVVPEPGSYWAVTRHADIGEVSRRPESSAPGAAPSHHRPSRRAGGSTSAA